MKIGSQLQLAIQKMDKQVDLARNALDDLNVKPLEAAKEIEAAKKAKQPEGNLGNHVDTEA